MKLLITFLLFLASLPALAAAPVASLVASRTSGTAPLCVHFDATGSTDADTTDPWRDLSYLVNFGDQSAGVWANGTGLTGKNIAAAPVSGHCYETAGTYTARLQVCDATACSSSTETITVTAADTTFASTATVCIANVQATAGAGGCPSGASTPAGTSDFDAALAACIGNTKRCLFKAGDTFTRSTTVNLGTSVLLHIGSYGSGADPVITGTNVTALTFNNATGSDIRVVDLDIVGNGATDTGLCGNFTASVTNVALIRMTCREMGKGLSVQTGAELTNFFVIDSHIYNYYASGGNSFYGHAINGVFLGSIFGPSKGSGEHGFRLQFGRKVAMANNTFRPPDSSSKHHLTIRGEPHTAGASWSDTTDTQYVAVTDNYFDALTSANPYIVQLAPSGNTQCHWGRDILLERNRWDIGSAAASPQAIITEFTRVTMRNNIVTIGDDDAAAFFVSKGNDDTCSADPAPNAANAPPNPDGAWIGYNTIRTTSTAISFYPIKIGLNGTKTVTNSTIKNNLVSSPGVTGTVTVPQVLATDGGTTISSNNSTQTEAKSTDPQFAVALPFTPLEYRVAVASYATNGGSAVAPGASRDFYLCRDRTGAARMGALVPAARAQCLGVAGAP